MRYLPGLMFSLAWAAAFLHGLLLYQAGGSLLSADGKQAGFRQKGGEALQYWVDMVNKHKIMKRPGGKDYNAWEVTNTDFINQKAAMIFTSTAFVNYLTENVKFKMGTAFLPKKEKFAAPTGGTFFVMIKDATPAESTSRMSSRPSPFTSPGAAKRPS